VSGKWHITQPSENPEKLNERPINHRASAFLCRRVSLAKPGYFFPHHIYLTFSPLTLALASFSSIPEQKHSTSTEEPASADEGPCITI